MFKAISKYKWPSYAACARAEPACNTKPKRCFVLWDPDAQGRFGHVHRRYPTYARSAEASASVRSEEQSITGFSAFSQNASYAGFGWRPAAAGLAKCWQSSCFKVGLGDAQTPFSMSISRILMV